MSTYNPGTKQWLEVVHYSYLKNPKYKWTLKNRDGGSFSNSGEYSSLKKLHEALRYNQPNLSEHIDVVFVVITGFDATNNPIERIYDMTFQEMFGERK